MNRAAILLHHILDVPGVISAQFRVEPDGHSNRIYVEGGNDDAIADVIFKVGMVNVPEFASRFNGEISRTMIDGPMQWIARFTRKPFD